MDLLSRLLCLGGAGRTKQWMGHELPPYVETSREAGSKPSKTLFPLIQADIHPEFLSEQCYWLCSVDSRSAFSLAGLHSFQVFWQSFWLEMLRVILSSEWGYDSAPLPVESGHWSLWDIGVQSLAQARFFI